MKKANLQVNNHLGRNKGEFFVSADGKLIPNTRNPAIWGAVDIEGIIPKDFLFDSHFMISFGKHTLKDGIPVRLSSFYKFQQSNFKAFAESTGMELAYCFNTKTSYNCPAQLNPDEPTIQTALSTIPQEKRGQYGSLVFSMLDDDEKLFSFSYILSKEEPTTDVRYGYKAISDFLKNNPGSLTQEELGEKITSLQREYSYQYMFRDAFGDVDYTSKNGGLIFNNLTQETHLAGNFDYGEMFSILYSTKILPPDLVDMSTLPEYTKNIPGLIESFERANNIKIQKHNMPAYDLGYKEQTFANESFRNLSTICEKFPDVALSFLNDLRNFKQSGLLVPLISETAGGSDEQLISQEEKTLVLDYIAGKTDSYEQTIVESLQKFASKDFVNEHKDEIEGQNIEEETTEQ